MASAEKLAEFRERACSVYRELSTLPSVDKAHVFRKNADGVCEVNAVWRQANVERGKSIKFAKTYFISQGEGNDINLRATSSFQQGVTAV